MTKYVGLLPRFTIEWKGIEYEAEVSKVELFHIGVEDHGIWTLDLRFSNQGMPGIGLDEYNKDDKKRYVHPLAGEYIKQIIDRVGSPEQAVGRRVIVLRDPNDKNHGYYIKGFARLNDDGSYEEPFLNEFPADTAPYKKMLDVYD